MQTVFYCSVADAFERLMLYLIVKIMLGLGVRFRFKA